MRALALELHRSIARALVGELHKHILEATSMDLHGFAPARGFDREVFDTTWQANRLNERAWAQALLEYNGRICQHIRRLSLTTDDILAGRFWTTEAGAMKEVNEIASEAAWHTCPLHVADTNINDYLVVRALCTIQELRDVGIVLGLLSSDEHLLTSHERLHRRVDDFVKSHPATRADTGGRQNAWSVTTSFWRYAGREPFDFQGRLVWSFLPFVQTHEAVPDGKWRKGCKRMRPGGMLWGTQWR